MKNGWTAIGWLILGGLAIKAVGTLMFFLFQGYNFNFLGIQVHLGIMALGILCLIIGHLIPRKPSVLEELAEEHLEKLRTRKTELLTTAIRYETAGEPVPKHITEAIQEIEKLMEQTNGMVE